MATLADGTRVFSAADNADILAADFNQLQDILIAMLETRRGIFWQGVPAGIAGSSAAAFANWIVREGTGGLVADAGFMFWEASGNDDSIVFPITGLMVGQVITDILVVVGGNPAATGGSINLYYGAPGAAHNTQDITSGTANVFDPGGILDEATSIPYIENAGVFPLTVVANMQYYVVVTSSAANGGANRVYDIQVGTQFGA